jgi:threonine dehydratase
VTVDHASITAAADQLAGHVRRTPVLEVDAGALADVPVVCKLEHLQVTGTFKARGAVATLLSSDRDEVAMASGGNAGAAFAHAARQLGRRATVFVSSLAPAAKIDRMRGYGADVRVVDGDYVAAATACEEYVATHDVLAGHAYDRPEMLLGSGTLARELAEQVDLDTLLVAVGGGGLIGGIASWYRGDVRVVAVETHGTPTLHRALAAGQPVDVDVSGIAASALGAGRVGDLAWQARGWVADSVLVDDAAVVEAQQALWEQIRQVAEPGGAVALAALRTGAYRPAPGERVGVLVCGANTDPGSVVTEVSS